jgi:hypothetical protein
MWNENTSYLHGGNDYLQYVSAKCSLGFVLTAVSPIGICSILFGNAREELDKAIRSEFPDRDPTLRRLGLEGVGARAVNAVQTPRAHISVPLHLVGTAAQVRAGCSRTTSASGTRARNASSIDGRSALNSTATNPLSDVATMNSPRELFPKRSGLLRASLAPSYRMNEDTERRWRVRSAPCFQIENRAARMRHA